jgi:hypothetical protein
VGEDGDAWIKDEKSVCAIGAHPIGAIEWLKCEFYTSGMSRVCLLNDVCG